MLLLVSAGNALAHPGHGTGGWLSASLSHLLSEPDHLALILAPLAAGVGWIAWKKRAGKVRARRENGDRPHFPG